MKRVSVVGNAGSRKSRLARRIAAVLEVPYVELDVIHHRPNWEPIDPDEFAATITALAAEDAWVIDGNYRTVVVDGPVWRRADHCLAPPGERLGRSVPIAPESAIRAA